MIGKIVTIYEDVNTQQIVEGQAEIILAYSTESEKNVLCLVSFVDDSDDLPVTRWVSKDQLRG